MNKTLGAAAAVLLAAPTAVETTPSPNELVVRYLACWNQRDPGKRRELVTKTWTADATYVDAHRRGAGLDGIDAMIAKAQEQHPGYVLRLSSGIEAHNGFIRFSWGAGGTEEAPLFIGGTDFAQVEGGKLKTVVGFVDAAPAH
jgi:hypothetical protein